MDGSRNPNGPGPQTNGIPNSQPSHSQANLLRIPTVGEALPYTPFSSIVPFNPDLITPALSLPLTTPTSFDHSDDIKNARTELERLSNGAQNAQAASQRCQQTLRDVQRLLDPEIITEYNFRTTKKFKAGNPSAPTKEPKLSPFAKMVYEDTNVAFRYLTPESEKAEESDNIAVKSKPKVKPEPTDIGDNIVVKSPQKVRPAQSTPISQQSQRPQPVPAPQQSSRLQSTPVHQQASQPKSRIAYVQLPAQQTLSSASQTDAGLISSQQITPTPSQSTPMPFVMPAKLTTAQLAEYQKVATSSDARDSTPSRNQSAHPNNGARAASLDQRLSADQAVETLQSLLQEIFAAEDQLEPDTSGDVSMLANAYFTTRNVDNGSVPVFKSEAQLRLENAVQKVVAFGRLDSIEIEQLNRLQKLCESSITAVGSASLEIGDDWNEQDTMDWLSRINNAQTGLVATRAMMRIMTGGSHHRELQSEDYLQSVLEAVRAVVERCIIPVVDLRPQLGEKIKGEKNAPRDPRFDIAAENRKPLQGIVSAMMKCLRLLGELFVKIDMDESGISNVEYTCKALLFAQNGATDKDSALGIQTFEKLRVSAMDVLARIFTKYTSQRNFIIDEILLSLEKLPATKQSARQFQLIDAKPIQLVSALLMRLVQTSATPNMKASRIDEEDDDEEESEESEIEVSEEEDSDDSEENIKVSSKKNRKGRQSKSKAQNRDLASVYEPLKEDSQKHARYIVHVLLQRASTTSKSSTDEPFRKLLDIFVADFLNVLGSCDWPAAEVLLRVLVGRLVGIAENAKSPAPSRTLALELLGVIGSGILDVQSGTIKAARALDRDSPTSDMLIDAAGLAESQELTSPAVTAFNGPYRVVIEYLHDRGLDNNPQLQSARGYHLVQWADLVCNVRESSTDDGNSVTPSSRDVQSKIRHMIEDVHWLEENSRITAPSTIQGRIAGKIVASTSLLARAFNRIFNVVLQSMTSEQPTVRSRALKSVTTLLEQDPSVLDRNSQVLAQIVRCLGDPSPLVRESALTLVQKCVTLRPRIELRVYDRIVARTTDANSNVRKRSMTFLKQVYIRNSDNKIRAPISNALISRIKDTDEGVAEAALATIEDVWFSALSAAKGDTDIDISLRLQSHAALIIETVELGDNVANVLQDLIKTLLTKSKQKAENFKTCKLFVNTLFDGFVDPKRIAGEPPQIASLRALEVFAKAAPKLFTAAHVGTLDNYISNVETSADLEMFHSVIIIFRFTLPVISGLADEQTKNILDWLLKYVSKVPKAELSAVAPCIDTISNMLGNKDRARSLVLSGIRNLNAKRDDDLRQDVKNVVGRTLAIVGQMGKACNLEKDIATFKTHFPAYRGTSVAALMVEICCHFTSPRQPLVPREAALEAVCEICQSFPETFLRSDVVNAIETVFNDRNTTLEGALLASLEGFFAKEDDDAEASEILGTGIESGAQRLGGTYQAKGYDSASASLSQRFLKEFLRIALSSIDENALCAARIVGWINERGMAHPGESGPGLVALQTCPGTAIAKLAFKAYMEQYTKHENVFEKSLVKSVQQAFKYQMEVVQSTTGYTGQPPVSKLHFFWQTLKSGKPKVRTKFFTNVCLAIGFDPVKLDLSHATPPFLLFVRFCVENFAFLEYERADEIAHLLSCLEKTFSGTGTALVQSIESEILNLQVPEASSSTINGDAGTGAFAEAPVAPAAPTVDPNRLHQLAVSAQLLSLMWETRSYLRKLWNMQRYSAKQKGNAKEPTKPNRATNAPFLTEQYQARISSVMALGDTEGARRGMCTAFVELFSVDNEVKVGSEEEDDIKYDDGDDARSEGSSAKSPSVGSGPRGKKRKSVDGGSGPAKKRGRQRKSSSAKMMEGSDEDGEWF